MRLTEVEVHHADLGTAYTAADWPDDFVDHLLGRRQRELAAAGVPLTLELTDRDSSLDVGPGGPRVSGATADVVWWLLGRGTGERLACSEPRLPDLGRWV
jgi:maleylpyruvate isomerase